MKLEELRPGLQLKGIIPHQSISVVDVRWHGDNAVELFYKRADGQTGVQLLFRQDEARLELAAQEQNWRFTADGDLFCLTAEAYRIHLAHLFDPVLFNTAIYGSKRHKVPI